jgi:pseudolysin/vibriolysin
MNAYYFVPSFFVFSLSTHAAAVVHLADINIHNYLTVGQQSLSADEGDYHFKLVKQVVLPNGLEKNKYALYYKGVPVLNSVLSSSQINGNQTQWHGQMLRGIEEDLTKTQPSLDEQAVVEMAKNQLQPALKDAITRQHVQLLIDKNEFSKAKLIYLVSFNIEGPQVARPFYKIDAHTGEILSAWDGLTTRSADGPGGNEKTGMYYYGRDFGYLEVSDKCEMTNAQVDTFDMNNETTGGSIYKFRCPTNTDKPVNGAYSVVNDAHYFASMVLEMYQNWYRINPLNSKFRLRVHYGSNYENAFWDGQQMTFGDGGAHLYPLTSLDVMAHEVSHGVTEKNSGLLYKGQSGGINEAFSDMAGEAAESYMNKQIGKENDWLVGGSIMKGPMGTALRYFKTPTKDGISIDHASNYNDSMDVHHTSGVFNKAFYLLATKPRWDINKAFGVFLTANQVYWEPEATFNSAACGVAKAAADLAYDVGDVVSSFKAVGVDAHCHITDPDSGVEVELPNGTVVSNIRIQEGDEHRYLIKVPVVRAYPYGYDVLSIRVYNSTGTAKASANLYVRYENGTLKAMTPSRSLTNGDESFTFKKPAAGNYHILIKGLNANSVSLNAFYGNYQ